MRPGALVSLGLALVGCRDPGAVSIPAPTGAHAVGVTELGAFYVTAWYPAQEGTGLGDPLYASGGMLGFYGMAPGDMGPVEVPAEIGALPAELDPRPLVVFGPGGSSWVELSTALATDLASRGYVVLAVQPDAYRESGFNARQEVPDDASLEVLERVAFEARAAQITAAIDLAGDPDTTTLVGEIDTTRIAVGGHSIGGDVAFRMGALDARVGAVFDLDGALHAPTLREPPTVPGLFVLASMLDIQRRPDAYGDTPDVQAGRDTLAWLPGADDVVSVGLEGAGHYAVTDLPVLLDALPKPIRKEVEADLGSIGVGGTTHTAALVGRFLDAVLVGGEELPSADELAHGLPGAVASPFS